VGSTLSNIAEMYLFQEDYGAARRYVEESIAIGDEVGEAGARASAYHILAGIEEAEGHYRAALESFRKAVDLDREILDVEKQNRIAEMEARYEAESRERQIELLEKNVEIQALALSRTRLRMVAILCGAALLVILVLSIFRRYLHLLAFWKKKSFISHYKIERQIGSGGMGVVYQASDVTGKAGSVALKVIREDIAGDPAQRKRFLNEAYLVDQLSHPNIVQVYERGEHEQTLYIAMELLEGRSLAQVIEQGERLSLSFCSRTLAQLADAVAQIHSQGIIHRDIKPENVMLVGGDIGSQDVKLLDFGLARAPSLTRLTRMGEILGTVTYLAPEQISRREVSTAGDVYAMGVVFYELLTLEKPFLGDTPGEIVKQILDAEPLDPSRFREDLPGGLNQLVLEMVAKDPAARPEAAEVVRRLGG
jgi:serine/threonine protein kinase